MRTLFGLMFLISSTGWAAIGRPTASIHYPTAAAPVVIRIVSPVVVKNDSIQLGEISEIQSTSTKELEDLKSLPIAMIPSDQEKLEIPAKYIQVRVRESLGMNRLVEFQIPEVVEFQRQFRLYTKESLEAEIRNIVAATMDEQTRDHISVELINFPGMIDCPQGSEIRVQPLAKQSYSIGTNQIAVHFLKGEAEVKPSLRLEINLQIKAQRWVSVREIGILQNLRPEDFELKEVAVRTNTRESTLPTSAEELAKIINGAKTKKFIRKGEILEMAHLFRAMDVERGQKIKVIIQNHGLRLITKGEVLRSGSVGSELRVRLEKSGRIVSGELKDKESMEIEL